MNTTVRARAYLAKLPPAIAGQAGSSATFAAACRLVEFGLSFDEALSVFAAWNQTHCQPPWSEPELRHKLADAFKRTQPKPEFVTARSRAAVSGVGRRVTGPGLLLITAASHNRSAQLALSKLTLTAGTAEQHAKIAQLRGLSPQAVALASERGLVRFGRYGHPAWFILDASQRVAQARRMDGMKWHGMKALNLAGSQASWPVGIREAEKFPSVALCEGGPDLLAAFHFILREQRQADCAPVAMLGACAKIHADALLHFAGKRVRIFGHADAQGDKAVDRWAAQLASVGAEVDAFNFAGLRQSDGSPVKDLNDLARVHLDDERQHDLEVLP